ncbi:MAG: hypothetical protein ACQSGP_30170 [Frankia sp.]
MGTGNKDGNAGAARGGKPGGSKAQAARMSERRAQVEAMRRAQARRDRIRVSALISGTALAVVAVIVLAIVFAGGSGSNGSGSSTDTSIDHSPSLLATTAGQVSGQKVHDITCGTEQLVTHIHAHLAVYVNGQAKVIPYGIGIVPPYTLDTSGSSPFVTNGTCFYWLHTHDETGIVHIEAPVKEATLTLGEVFDEWRQPLSTTQVGPAKGKVTAVVDGKTYAGDPRAVPLTAHEVIQLSVGTVVPFKNYTFASGL